MLTPRATVSPSFLVFFFLSLHFLHFFAILPLTRLASGRNQAATSKRFFVAVDGILP